MAPERTPGIAVPDAIARAMAAADQAPESRPYTVSIQLETPERVAFLTVPLDITDTELLFLFGQFAINGRSAILAKREVDRVASTRRLVPVGRIPGLT